jgi:hypothetical protein
MTAIQKGKLRLDCHRRRLYPPKPQKRFREDEVTVCIAIACDCFCAPPIKPKLVLITDQMISTETSSTEIGGKVRQVAKNWYAMFAGNDVTHAENVLAKAKNSLAGGTWPDSLQVSQHTTHAYQLCRETKIKSTLLASYDWDIDYFMKNGRRLLGQAEFTTRLYQIEQVDLGCCFLIAGFTPREEEVPTMFCLDNPGTVRPETLTGYSAIGTGARNALAYLDWRRQNWRLPLEESIYNGIAAKALGESALGVGPGTCALILERGAERPRALKPQEISAIKELWLKEEAPARPKDLKARISAILSA